nr:hypothetical protein [Tanacetum cinerariifolium]
RLVDQAQGDVFFHRQPREQAVLLKDDAALAADAIHGLAVDADLPAKLAVQADQQAQQGGLAAAAGTDDGDEFALGDVQVEVADGLQFAAIDFEELADLLKADQGGVGVCHACLQRVARASMRCPITLSRAPVRPTSNMPLMITSMRISCCAPIIRLPMPPLDGM